MSKKIQKACRYIESIKVQEKILSTLAEKDYDLYVLMLISMYEGIAIKDVIGLKIKDLILTHATVKRVVSEYVKDRDQEEYLIKSKVASNIPIRDAEYEIRKAIALR